MSSLRSLLVIGALAVQLACTRSRSVETSRSPEELRALAREVGRIEQLPPKRGQPQQDPRARAIVAQGEAIAPYLVDEIADTTRTRVVDVFQYKRGDVALALLDEICMPRHWPFPDGSRALPGERSVYDYVEFVEVQANREAIQQSWEKFARRGGCRPDAGR